jgi:hypothetical protein
MSLVAVAYAQIASVRSLPYLYSFTMRLSTQLLNVHPTPEFPTTSGPLPLSPSISSQSNSTSKTSAKRDHFICVDFLAPNPSAHFKKTLHQPPTMQDQKSEFLIVFILYNSSTFSNVSSLFVPLKLRCSTYA